MGNKTKISNNAKGAFQKVLLWLLAAFALVAAVALFSYLRSGWQFFDAGKNVKLPELADWFSNADGSVTLSIDKGSMSASLLFDQDDYSSSFVYRDGSLRMDLSEYERKASPSSGAEKVPSGVFTVVQRDVVYWPSQDIFLVGAAS